MIITHHREKLINAIVYFAKNTRYCGKTKLMKLLFFLDFWHFRQTGKSVTGLDYYAWERGPVPKALFEELDHMEPDLREAVSVVKSDDFQGIKARKKVDTRYFTKRELALLEKISFIFKEAKAGDISEVSHLRNQPWFKTLQEKGEYAKIDYMLSVDEREPDSLTLDEARERVEAIWEMHQAFEAA